MDDSMACLHISEFSDGRHAVFLRCRLSWIQLHHLFVQVRSKLLIRHLGFQKSSAEKSKNYVGTYIHTYIRSNT